MIRFTRDDVGNFFLDSEGHVWQCLSYTDQPTVQLKSLQTNEKESFTAVVDSPAVQGFKRLVPEVQ